jgi:ankyrin repeat protein
MVFILEEQQIGQNGTRSSKSNRKDKMVPVPELLNKHDYDKRTALHLAAAEGHIDLVNFIVKKTDVDKGKKDR